MVIQNPRWGFTVWWGHFWLLPMNFHRQYAAIGKAVNQVIRRTQEVKVEGGSWGVPDAGEFGVLYPTLWEHLTAREWEDGVARLPSSITIFTDGAVVKCVLKDKETNLCLWMACQSMDGLFNLVEAALLDVGTVWRQDRQANAGKSARTKPAR